MLDNSNHFPNQNKKENIETNRRDIILQALNSCSDQELKQKYLNQCAWTESILQAAATLEQMPLAIHLVTLAIDVDLALAARVAGAVKPEFQATTIAQIMVLKLPRIFKLWLLNLTDSPIALPALQRFLQKGNFLERSLALKLFQPIKNKNTEEILMQSLQDRDERIQTLAAEVLGEIGGSRAEQALINALNDSRRIGHLILFSKIIHVLEKIGTPATQAALKQVRDQIFLEETKQAARSPYEENLRQRNGAETIHHMSQMLESWDPNHRCQAAAYLGDLQDDRAIPVLVSALYDRETKVWKKALVSLMQLGSAAAEEALSAILGIKKIWFLSSDAQTGKNKKIEYAWESIQAALPTRNNEIRARIAVLLGCIPQPAAVNLLIHLLQDQSPLVRSCSIESLGQIGGHAVFPIVTKHFQEDEAVIVRCSAIDALAKIAYEGTEEMLIAALEHDPVPAVRYQAVAALGSMGLENMFRELVNTADESTARFLKKRAEVGRKLIGDSVWAWILAGLDIKIRKRILNQANITQFKKSNQAIQGLLVALQNQDPEVRYQAARYLGQIGSEKAVPGLIASFSHPQVEVRQAVAHALGLIQSEKALEVLLKAFADPAVAVRKAAVGAIYKFCEALNPVGRMFDFLDGKVRMPAPDTDQVSLSFNRDHIASALNQAAQDPDREVRYLAYLALDSVASQTSVPVLLHGLTYEKDGFLRQLAATALIRLKSPDSVPALIQALKDQEHLVGSRAAMALGEMQCQIALEALLTAAQKGDWTVRHFAAEALGKIKHPQSQAVLVKALQDDNAWVRKAAAWALGELNDPKPGVEIIHLLEDEDNEVRENAADALGKIGHPKMLPYLKNIILDGDEKALIVLNAIKKIQARYQYYNPDYYVAET